MKRFILLSALLATLLPLQAQRSLYDRFAQRRDLTVAYAKQFPVDEALKVDVVLLRARNEQGWNYLLRTFSVAEESATHARLSQDPTRPVASRDQAKNCVLLVEPSERTLCVFYTGDIERLRRAGSSLGSASSRAPTPTQSPRRSTSKRPTSASPTS